MKVNILFYRRILLVCAALFIIVALVIALGVIPPAKADTYPGVPHDLVAVVFLVILSLNLLSALFLFLVAIKIKKLILVSKPILIIIGLLVLILGPILADGGFAWQKHGPSMQSASLLVFICAAVDFLVGITVMTTAFLMPKEVN